VYVNELLINEQQIQMFKNVIVRDIRIIRFGGWRWKLVFGYGHESIDL